MIRIVCTFLVGLVVLGSAPGSSAPLPVRDHFLLGVGFLALEPASADVTADGNWQMDAVWSVANTWAISYEVDKTLQARGERGPVTVSMLEELAAKSFDGGSIYLDGEVSRLLFAIRRGFGGNVQVELRVPLIDFGGGQLDGVIDDLHQRFALAKDGRAEADKDEFLIRSTSRRGDLLVQEPPSLGLGDVVVGAKVMLSSDPTGASRTAIEALIKFPTGGGEPIGTSGSVDVGLQFLASHDFSRWSIHGAAGIVFLGSSGRLGLGSQEIFSLSGTVEHAIGRRARILLQLDVSESPFRGFDTSRIGNPSFHATLGLAQAFRRQSELYIAATENFENFTNTADITVHFGFSRKFSR